MRISQKKKKIEIDEYEKGNKYNTWSFGQNNFKK